MAAAAGYKRRAINKAWALPGARCASGPELKDFIIMILTLKAVDLLCTKHTPGECADEPRIAVASVHGHVKDSTGRAPTELDFRELPALILKAEREWFGRLLDSVHRRRS
jgi:hypothetical protein